VDDGTTLLSFCVVEGILQSTDYVKLVKQSALPIRMLNFGNNYFFQQDNTSVHTSKEAK